MAQDMQDIIRKTLREHEVSILGMQLACRTCGPVAQTQTEHQTTMLASTLATPAPAATDEDRTKLGKLLFSHPVSNECAPTAPEIADLCEDAASTILAAGYRKL